MKKNKMMRIASILLVVTLLSTCVISGTFAKYVTKAEGQDQARVAKWGIIVGVEGDSIFNTQYKTDDTNGYDGEYSVVADESINLLDMDEPEHVVAPGTKGDGLKGTVKGKPEVATRYALTIKNGWSDIVLPKGTYTDYTNYVLGEGYKKMENESSGDYAPIKWDINVYRGEYDPENPEQNKIVGLLSAAAEFINQDVATLNGYGVYGFSATEAKTILENYSDRLIPVLQEAIPSGKNPQIKVENGDITISIDFDPGKEMDYTFVLVWSWNFEGKMTAMTGPTTFTTFDAKEVDILDTFLGNWVAYAAMVAANEDPTTLFTDDQINEFKALDAENYKISATVIASATQID